MTETHTLYTYAKRLEDTPPFNPGMETAVLGVAYVLWEKDTKDFFMRLDQSAGAFRNISAYSTDVFLTQLFALNEAASVGHLPYHLNMYCMKQEQRAGIVMIIPPLTHSLVFRPNVPCRYSGPCQSYSLD